MAYNVNQKATVGQLKALALRAKGAIDAAIEALPVELFLDTAKTVFVQTFAFNATTYPGATNPNMDGKPVLVLALKGVDNTAPTDTAKQTTTYSFLNMETLVDTYTAKAGDSAKILNISGYEIEVKIDPSSANKLSVTNDGLMVDVRVSGATNGHVAGLDASGNLTDSGVVAADILTKLSGATTGNILKITSTGTVEDAGIAAADIITTADIATDAEVTEMLNEVFGAQS